MESELLCTPNDALIIPDKMQPAKEDADVAQQIQAECDKKCSEAQDAPTTNGNDADETAQMQNGDRAQEEAREEQEDVVVEEELPAQEAQENRAEEQQPEPDVQLDSLNVDNAEDEGAHARKAEIVETIEKPVEIPQTVEEIVPCSTFEPAGDQPDAQRDNVQETAPESPVQNGHEEKEDSEDLQTSETPVPAEAPDSPDAPEVPEVPQEVPRDESIPDQVPDDEEPVKGHYQPEKIENFGISVKEMVSEMPRLIEDEMKAPKESMPNGPRKGAMATSMDTESVRDAYNDIRADNSDTTWAVFKYEASRIVCSAKGVAFDEFKKQFDEGERAYGYIRLQTGDEMSKRHKFLFVTWIGPGVSVLKRAKMSIDKAIIKNVVSNFAVELQLEALSEFDLPFFVDSLNKASGANYGTGVREI